MLQAVLDGAREEGHELELVFFRDGPWPAALSDAGFRVEVIAAGRLREIHRWITSVFHLAGVFHRRRPDVILNWAAKTQLYGSPAALLVGMADRVVWWQQAIPRRSWLDGSATLLPAAAIGCYSGASARAQGRLFPARRTFVVGAGAPVPQDDGSRRAGGAAGAIATATRRARGRPGRSPATLEGSGSTAQSPGAAARARAQDAPGDHRRRLLRLVS